MSTFATGSRNTRIDFSQCKYPGRYEYTTRTSGYDFVFDVNKDAGEYRAYITDSPSYGRRASDGHSTHRLVDGSGRKYVCIPGNNLPENVEETLTWAVMWAEGTAHYIDSGRFKESAPL